MRKFLALGYHALLLSTLGLVACSDSANKPTTPESQLSESLAKLQGEFGPAGVLCDGTRKPFPSGDGAQRTLKIEENVWSESAAALTYKNGVEFTRNTESTSGVVVASDPEKRQITLLTTGRVSVWQMSGRAPETTTEALGVQKPFSITYRELGNNEIALTAPTGVPEQLSPLLAHLDASCADYAVILKRK